MTLKKMNPQLANAYTHQISLVRKAIEISTSMRDCYEKLLRLTIEEEKNSSRIQISEKKITRLNREMFKEENHNDIHPRRL
jgi:hypothetical protein